MNNSKDIANFCIVNTFTAAIFTVLFFSHFPISLSAQESTGAYDILLKGMYRNTVPLVKAQQLSFELIRDSSIVLLDTREPAEYKVSHLRGAINSGYDYFTMKTLKNIPPNSKVVVYCSVGFRSERIGEKLIKAGFKDVRNLYGGIFEWVNEDYPVVDNKEKKTNLIHGYSPVWGIWLNKGEKTYDK